jgi:hypothetical protein
VTAKHAGIWPGSEKHGSGIAPAAIGRRAAVARREAATRRQAAQIGRASGDRVDVALARLAVHGRGEQPRGIGCDGACNTRATRPLSTHPRESGDLGRLPLGLRFRGGNEFVWLPDEERGGGPLPLFFGCYPKKNPLFFEKIPLLFRVGELLLKCL